MTSVNSQTLFDRFHAATFARPGKYVEDLITQDLINYRLQLRKANAFTLDEEAVSTIVRTSLTTPARIGLFASLARLPYDVTWIEWNQHHRLREADRLGSAVYGGVSEDTPLLGGFLLIRDPRTEAAFDAVFVTDLDPKKEIEGNGGVLGGIRTAPWVVSYRVDPERGIIHPSSSLTKDQPWDFIRDAFPKDKEWDHLTSGMEEMKRNPWHMMNLISTSTGWGYRKVRENHLYTWEGAHAAAQEAKTKATDGFDLPQELYGYALARPEIILSRILSRLEGKDREYQQRSAKAVFQVSHEQAGDLRFLVTALALINEIPYRTAPITKPSHHTTRLKKIAYLAQSTITLVIPKTRPVEFVEKRLNTADKRRAHMVRGHWRSYEHKRVWIKPHQRGDASLGWVKHQYEVTS